MKRLVYLLTLMLSIALWSCRSVKYVPVESSTDSIIIEKLIPVVNPADSANIRALLECDENGKVLLKWYDTEVSKNAKLNFQLDSLGRLLADFSIPPDTVFMPSKEVIVEKNIKVPYPVEKQLSWWQQFKMDIGGYAIVIGIILLILIIRKYICRV